MIRLLKPFSLYRYHDFRYLNIGMLFYRIGTEMFIVGVNWHIYMLTKSALSLGIIGFSRFLALIICFFPAGILADTFNRKRIMLISQVVLFFSALLITLFTFYGKTTPALIYIAMALITVASMLDSPARNSIIPQLVPKDIFMRAVGLNTIAWQIAIVLGPSIAGFIIAFYGVLGLYASTTFGFLLSFLCISLVKVPAHFNSSEAKKFNIFSYSMFREGIRYVASTKLILGTMFLDFFATFFGSALTLMPIFAIDILHVGPQGLGILYAAPSIGAICSGLIFNSFPYIKKQGRILAYSIVVYGIATFFFGISKNYILSLLFLFIAGSGDMLSSIIRGTLRQMATPDRLRGRMYSISMIFSAGGPQLGEVESGIMATLIGTPQAVSFGGIAAVFTTFMVFKLVPRLLVYDNHLSLDANNKK